MEDQDPRVMLVSRVSQVLLVNQDLLALQAVMD